MDLKTKLMNETGATLVVAMIILIALTLIGLSLVTTSRISSDVAGLLKDNSTAFHAADACLKRQISEIKNNGAATTAINNWSLGGGVSCSATEPSSTGSFAGGGTAILEGFSLEEGSGGVAYISYEFSVSGTSPRNQTTSMDVVVKLPVATGT